MRPITHIEEGTTENESVPIIDIVTETDKTEVV